MVLKQEKEQDYYQVGTKENKIISNSFLNALDPSTGGSPQKALSFFDRDTEKEESKSLENGKIIHSYSENPEEFGIASIPRPSDTLGNLCDALYDLISGKTLYLTDTPTEITSNLKTEGGKSAEILETKKAYEDLQIKLGVNPTELIKMCRVAREKTEAYTTYKEATVINTIINKGGVEYINQLSKLENKHILSLADKDKIEKAITSLRAHELANKYFALGGQFDNNLVFKEWDIYFKIGEVNAKSRIDNIYIDLDTQIIYINDLKTTSKPISLFPEAIERYKYYRQLPFYGTAVRKAIKAGTLMPQNTLMSNMDFSNFKIVYQIIAIELGNYYTCQVIRLGEELIKKGITELQSLTERFTFHEQKNIWDKTKEEVEGNGIITLNELPK